jgi:hypothetical protein
MRVRVSWDTELCCEKCNADILAMMEEAGLTDQHGVDRDNIVQAFQTFLVPEEAVFDCPHDAPEYATRALRPGYKCCLCLSEDRPMFFSARGEDVDKCDCGCHTIVVDQGGNV